VCRADPSNDPCARPRPTISVSDAGACVHGAPAKGRITYAVEIDLPFARAVMNHVGRWIEIAALTLMMPLAAVAMETKAEIVVGGTVVDDHERPVPGAVVLGTLDSIGSSSTFKTEP